MFEFYEIFLSKIKILNQENEKNKETIKKSEIETGEKNNKNLTQQNEKSRKINQILVFLENLIKILLVNLETLQKDHSQLNFPAKKLFEIDHNPKYQRFKQILHFETKKEENSENQTLEPSSGNFSVSSKSK